MMDNEPDHRNLKDLIGQHVVLKGLGSSIRYEGVLETVTKDGTMARVRVRGKRYWVKIAYTPSELVRLSSDADWAVGGENYKPLMIFLACLFLLFLVCDKLGL